MVSYIPQLTSTLCDGDAETVSGSMTLSVLKLKPHRPDNNRVTVVKQRINLLNCEHRLKPMTLRVVASALVHMGHSTFTCYEVASAQLR